MNGDRVRMKVLCCGPISWLVSQDSGLARVVGSSLDSTCMMKT